MPLLIIIVLDVKDPLLWFRCRVVFQLFMVSVMKLKIAEENSIYLQTFYSPCVWYAVKSFLIVYPGGG